MDGPQTYTLAAALTRQLCGVAVERLTVPSGRWQANVLLLHCAGQVIQRISSHGKWLIFDFSHGVSWACCLLAKSRWQISQTDPKADVSTASPEPKRVAGREPLLVVYLRNGRTATLRGRPLFLTLPTATLWHHRDLRDLGPDPLVMPELTHRPGAAFVEGSGPFGEVFLPRVRAAATRTLASALLDQSIVAGVGNPLKCEILFTLGLAPATRVGALYATLLGHVAATLEMLLRQSARELLELARSGSGTTSTFRVYDRAGEPCEVCGHAIEVDRSGADGRWSWHCPHCQRQPTTATLF